MKHYKRMVSGLLAAVAVAVVLVSQPTPVTAAPVTTLAGCAEYVATLNSLEEDRLSDIEWMLGAEYEALTHGGWTPALQSIYDNAQADYNDTADLQSWYILQGQNISCPDSWFLL